MIQNYIKISFRNLAKHQFFSLLNVTGLALGMSACLTVILIVRDQLGYDHFHPNGARVYRIVCQQEDGMKLASVPYPLGETLVRDFSAVESSVRLVRSIQNIDATAADNLTLPVSGFYAEPSFFKVFGFQLEIGNAATALNEPNTIVLSKKTAERFFGASNPVGNTLTLKGKGAYRITGVMAPPPGKTHLVFDCLASANSMIAIEQAYKPEDAAEKVIDNWENRYMSYVYVRLNPGQTKSDLSKALAAVGQDRAKAGKSDQAVRFYAQNIENIIPKPEMLANDLGGGAPMFFIWGLSFFVLILTIFPCLNYANMATAQALARAREMGVRKAIGARSSDVKQLILMEAVLTALLALPLAWLLHLPLNHFVETQFPSGATPMVLRADALTWVFFVAFGMAVGLLAGWLPARRLAKLTPVVALRGNSSGQTLPASRFGWRTALLVGQFAVSLIFMIVVATLWGQMRYMAVSDYGFQKENLLTVELQGNKVAIVAAEMALDPHVAGVCASSVLIASENLQGVLIQRERGGEAKDLHCALVDENYVPVMGLQLIAGENFPKKTTAKGNERLIVNEKALPAYQLGTAAEAVGKVLWLNDSTPAVVQGVVRDFHYRSLEHAIEPFALRFAPMEYGLLHVRLQPGDPTDAMASLGSIWKKMDKNHAFKAEFMEASIQRAYNHVTLIGGLVGFFALLALSLACMGLLGMVTYTVGTKVKEIGIRKVLGASAAEVTLLLSRRFLMLLAVAVAIALPTGYFLSNLLLQIFASRIAVGGLILGGSALAVLLLGLLTIGVQAVRAALANPVSSLRSE